MINYVANAERQVIEWARQTRPDMYMHALQMTGGRMGESTESSGSGFWGGLYSGIKDLASTIYAAKTADKQAKREMQAIVEQNKQQAIQAQRDAINAQQQREYQAQVQALQREQDDIARRGQDTALMIGGVVLAALVGAKLLKII